MCDTCSRSILTIALRLPDGVAESPQRRNDVVDSLEIAGGDPDEEEDHEADVQDASDADDGLARHVARQQADDDWEDGVCHAERDHVRADVLDADRARDVRLQRHAAGKEVTVEATPCDEKLNWTDTLRCMYNNENV